MLVSCMTPFIPMIYVEEFAIPSIQKVEQWLN